MAEVRAASEDIVAMVATAVPAGPQVRPTRATHPRQLAQMDLTAQRERSQSKALKASDKEPQPANLERKMESSTPAAARAEATSRPKCLAAKAVADKVRQKTPLHNREEKTPEVGAVPVAVQTAHTVLVQLVELVSCA